MKMPIKNKNGENIQFVVEHNKPKLTNIEISGDGEPIGFASDEYTEESPKKFRDFDISNLRGPFSFDMSDPKIDEKSKEYPELSSDYIKKIWDYFSRDERKYEEAVDICLSNKITIKELKLLEVVFSEDLDSVTRNGISVFVNSSFLKISRKDKDKVIDSEKYGNLWQTIEKKRKEDAMKSSSIDGFDIETPQPIAPPDITTTTTSNATVKAFHNDGNFR